MEILRKSGDYNIILNQENDFQTNLGWEEGMDIFEDEVLSTIINPIDNYETIRYIHEPYNAVINGTTVNQCDIWFKFFFIDANTSYNNGLDYSLIGIAPKDNANMIKTSTESYFRLEYFKTPNNEPPTRMNRKLVFSKNLQLPIGEKFYYNTLRQNIHVPVFMGSNYRNKENMYLFWFQDDTVLSDSTLSGNTFFMTAKFLNASDGSIIDFTNSRLLTTDVISEYADLYYKVVINKSGYTYNVYNYDGTQNERVGNGLSNSINFYEKGGESAPASSPLPTPAASPAPTPAASPAPTPAASPAPTPAPSSGGGSPTYNVSVNRTSIDETGPNNSVTVTVNTTNVANGTTLYWGLTTASSIILTLPPVSDFSGETYNLIITNNQGSFTLTAIEDFRTEGPATSETFAIEIKTGNTAGPVVGTTPLLSLNDTSKDPPIFTYYDVRNCDSGSTGLVMRYPGPDNLDVGVYVISDPLFNPQQVGIVYRIIGVSTQTIFTLYYKEEVEAPSGGCN
jgi:hypothetical protein